MPWRRGEDVVALDMPADRRAFFQKIPGACRKSSKQPGRPFGGHPSARQPDAPAVTALNIRETAAVFGV